MCTYVSIYNRFTHICSSVQYIYIRIYLHFHTVIIILYTGATVNNINDTEEDQSLRCHLNEYLFFDMKATVPFSSRFVTNALRTYVRQTHPATNITGKVYRTLCATHLYTKWAEGKCLEPINSMSETVFLHNLAMKLNTSEVLIFKYIAFVYCI